MAIKQLCIVYNINITICTHYYVSVYIRNKTILDSNCVCTRCIFVNDVALGNTLESYILCIIYIPVCIGKSKRTVSLNVSSWCIRVCHELYLPYVCRTYLCRFYNYTGLTVLEFLRKPNYRSF